MPGAAMADGVDASHSQSVNVTAGGIGRMARSGRGNEGGSNDGNDTAAAPDASRQRHKTLQGQRHARLACMQARMLGRCAWAATADAMRAFTDARTDATPDELWLAEHEPVFTQGI